MPAGRLEPINDTLPKERRPLRTQRHHDLGALVGPSSARRGHGTERRSPNAIRYVLSRFASTEFASQHHLKFNQLGRATKGRGGGYLTRVETSRGLANRV